MNNQDLFSNLEDSKLIAAVMERAGIEQDGWWIEYDDDITEPQLLSNKSLRANALQYGSWRLDKVLMVLPDWCFEGTIEFTGATTFKFYECDFLFDNSKENHRKIKQFSINIACSYVRGKEALHAACQLVKLLDKEGLLT